MAYPSAPLGHLPYLRGGAFLFLFLAYSSCVLLFQRQWAAAGYHTPPDPLYLRGGAFLFLAYFPVLFGWAYSPCIPLYLRGGAFWNGFDTVFGGGEETVDGGLGHEGVGGDGADGPPLGESVVDEG